MTIINTNTKSNDTYDYEANHQFFESDTDTKDTDQLLTIRFELSSYLLTMLYFSYTYKLSYRII